MRDAFTIATWCCRRWRVFDRSNPFPGCGRGLHQGPSKRGAAGLEPASASALPFELRPLRTVINPSANARPQEPASYGRSPARQPSTDRRPRGPAPRPLHDREFAGPCPHPWMVRRRGRIRTCNIRFQRPSCCQLHHPPICRFARPPTRWTPSAGPDVTGTARHCDHPQTLAVPRQGGCRGDPSHGSGARRVPHARRVAYLACLRRDLNPRPSAPEADALSTGPRRQSATYPRLTQGLG